MGDKIQTKVFRRGNPCESSWPGDFGTGEKGIFHVDKESGELVEGFPPPEVIPYDQAPLISMRTLKPMPHPQTGEVIDTVTKWDAVNDAYGLTTIEKHVPAKDKRAERMKKAAAERKKAMLKSIAQIDAGTAPLNEEQRELCRIQNDIVSEALNFNAHDVAGRKNSAAGKKYRKRYKR